jgi:hypothetical protein
VKLCMVMLVVVTNFCVENICLYKIFSNSAPLMSVCVLIVFAEVSKSIVGLIPAVCAFNA